MAKYQVIVGNIKTLHFNNKEAATTAFEEYVRQSRIGMNSVIAEQSVTLAQGGSTMYQILKEFNYEDSMQVLVEADLNADATFIERYGINLKSDVIGQDRINDLCKEVRENTGDFTNKAFDEICEKCYLILKDRKYKIIQHGDIWAEDVEYADARYGVK